MAMMADTMTAILLSISMMTDRVEPGNNEQAMMTITRQEL